MFVFSLCGIARLTYSLRRMYAPQRIYRYFEDANRASIADMGSKSYFELVSKKGRSYDRWTFRSTAAAGKYRLRPNR
jgi:hypothetical protein